MNTHRRVVITGMGVITPIGNDVETFWRILQNGVSGIDCITRSTRARMIADRRRSPRFRTEELFQ